MKFLVKAEGVAVSCLILLMAAAGFVQVVTRYVFKIPLFWIEEFARYLMVWMVFIGAALAISKQAHLRVDVLDFLLPQRVKDILHALVSLLIAVFAFAFGLSSYELIIDQVEIGQVSPAMQVPMGAVYSVLLVGSGLIVIHAFHELVTLFARKKASKEK